MRLGYMFGFAGLAASPLAAHDVALNPGIYTNVEEVYFDDLAKRSTAPNIAISIAEKDGESEVQSVDPYGAPADMKIDGSKLYQQSSDQIIYTLPDGRTTELRKARTVSCWASVKRPGLKADGSEDWYFTPSVKLHDQGGRALIGGGDSEAQQVMIRIRNVTWAKDSTNRPVISLYVHKPEDPVRAVSYSWASPEAGMIGINLRWVQTGCTVDGVGPQSKVSADKFKP